MRLLYAALLGIAVAGAPLAGQVVGTVQTQAAPNEDQHIALTQQHRMVSTFARRIEIASEGEEEDVRANAEKLGGALDNAAAGLDALAKVTDAAQSASLDQIRKFQAEARKHYELLKAEVAKTPMELKQAKAHAAAVREQSELAEDVHAKMLAPSKPEPTKPQP